MVLKPSKMFRGTCVQEWRIIVDPEDVFREVQLFIPDSPRVSLLLDTDPKDLGLNRNYKGVGVPPGQNITIRLAPGQFVLGIAHENFAEVGVIVEYPAGA